jgi:hypothetical protein
VLFFGRELNDWKIVASPDEALNQKYFETMQWATTKNPAKGVTLTWNPDQPTISQYVFTKESCPYTAVVMNGSNFNTVAFKIAEMAAGTPNNLAGTRFRQRVAQRRGSPVVFGDISPFGLPTDFLKNAAAAKKQYGIIQGSYIETFADELMSVLQSSRMLPRIRLAIFCGADTAERQHRVSVIAEHLRATGTQAALVTKFPFLVNFRKGGPSGFVQTLRSEHPDAYTHLQSIMAEW